MRRSGRGWTGHVLLALLLFGPAPAAGQGSDAGTIERGRYLAVVAGCSGCHSRPGEAEFAGGAALKTPFGTFKGPNITPDPEHGIGAWSDRDFLGALKHGLSPGGAPYYPAFPYTSFAHLSDEDALAIKAFLFSLPPAPVPDREHDLNFPYGFRPGLWLWRWLNFEPEPFAPPAGASAAVARGAYLVQAVAHCGECHTPRNWMGASDPDRQLAGTADAPIGGKIPNITPAEKTGTGSWSEADLARVLESGLLPDFDAVGGAMGEVVRASTSKMTPEDRAAIAAYLRTVPAIENPAAPATQPEF